ncbi:MAG TPA: Holliday junction resolvase RuvX [Candidatus Pacebacteria bacterium]|nr:Holliday junction resolvase RuvX [Candidatus Paceibacterota bacterium]
MLPFPPKTLALDYGTRRIGVAVSTGTLAEPLEVVSNRPEPEAFANVVSLGALRRIKTLCQDHQVAQILIGLSEGKMAELTQKFAQFVKTECQLPIIFWDETLSSVTVVSRLKAAKIDRRSQPKIDHFAAATILEDWLENQ